MRETGIRWMVRPENPWWDFEHVGRRTTLTQRAPQYRHLYPKRARRNQKTLLGGIRKLIWRTPERRCENKAGRNVILARADFLSKMISTRYTHNGLNHFEENEEVKQWIEKNL